VHLLGFTVSVVRDELEQARLRYEIARAEFTHVCTDIPSGLPQPDETQRLKNAARDQRTSREAFQLAVNRFNDFILRGKTPDDLRSGAPVWRGTKREGTSRGPVD
jgi:hypothetical protein